MSLPRIDLLFGYTLAAAAQEDPGEQELGPIHLLKYAYLGDLAYAETHGGKTFSGIPWRFHHFGPWSPEAFQRLEPAMERIGAVVRSFPSSYREEDAKRWRLPEPALIDSLERQIPAESARAIRHGVHRFGSDTSSLLHHVYKTPPMLRAAPGEPLQFGLDPAGTGETEPADAIEPMPRLSGSHLKRLQARVRQMIQEKKQRKPGVPVSPPRYDEVFEAGTRWLDSLAGEPVTAAQGQLRFSPAVWKSKARRDGDLP